MEQDKTVLTWKEVVRDALIELGGKGHLSDINKIVEGHPKTKTNPTWRDTVRRVVRQYKIFVPVPPERSGIYKLTDESIVDVKGQKFSKQAGVNHDIAQGMLAVLGRTYGYETYAPKNDQSMRIFQDKPLGEFVSINDCTDIFKGPNSRNISDIDTIWFDEDDYGLFPTYAFEVEHSTKVKSGLDRLLKIPRRFNVQFFIVAPGEEEEKMFDRHLSKTPFRDFSDRFSFRTYTELEELYNSAIQHYSFRSKFGIKERWSQ